MKAPVPFTKSLYAMIHEYPQIIQWVCDGSLVIHSPKKLQEVVLPIYFRHGKYASFQRQLNNFGYRKTFVGAHAGPTIYRPQFNFAQGYLDPGILLTLRHTQRRSQNKCSKDNHCFHEDMEAQGDPPYLAAQALLSLKTTSV